ncbi:hypothetical protein [Virgibacillus oceani]|uniref:Uncharacterized protein n=1 Tax=Virgibacillus oceani TaxID=1479511 RepID=A0A917HTF8_9BACI|nr:hypothetical protein [Virgibacillus oceani]GGG88672.1 hypothetical protein GCM10011398_38340 [Virgibacillus oceani]
MQLSEYRREVKRHSLKSFLKEFMYSNNKVDSIRKGRTEYSEHRITSHSQKPPVIETIADYVYNRKFYQ